MKDLIKIHIRVSFISIAYVVVKIKIFKVFRIDSAFLGGFFGPYSPKMFFDLAETLTNGSLQ